MYGQTLLGYSNNQSVQCQDNVPEWDMMPTEWYSNLAALYIRNDSAMAQIDTHAGMTLDLARTENPNKPILLGHKPQIN